MYVKDCTVLLSWCMAWSVECGGRMWSVVLRVGNWRKEDEEREEKTVLRYYYYYYYCYKKNPTNHNEWLPHKIVIWCCYVITHSCFLSSSFPKYYFFIVCFSFSFGTECEEHKKNLALNSLSLSLRHTAHLPRLLVPVPDSAACSWSSTWRNWSPDEWVASLSWMLLPVLLGWLGMVWNKKKSKHWICGEGGASGDI